MRYLPIAIVALMLLLILGVIAHAHDMSTHYAEFLYNRDGVNCCLSVGDCKPVPHERVQVTPKGYLLENGELVTYRETNQSPDEHYYACSNVHKCFFAPPGGV